MVLQQLTSHKVLTGDFSSRALCSQLNKEELPVCMHYSLGAWTARTIDMSGRCKWSADLKWAYKLYIAKITCVTCVLSVIHTTDIECRHEAGRLKTKGTLNTYKITKGDWRVQGINKVQNQSRQKNSQLQQHRKTDTFNTDHVTKTEGKTQDEISQVSRDNWKQVNGKGGAAGRRQRANCVLSALEREK